MAELGNLTGGILLSLHRMSTVKIRAGSLFRNPLFRIRDGEAGKQWSVVSGRWSVS